MPTRQKKVIGQFLVLGCCQDRHSYVAFSVCPVCRPLRLLAEKWVSLTSGGSTHKQPARAKVLRATNVTMSFSRMHFAMGLVKLVKPIMGYDAGQGR